MLLERSQSFLAVVFIFVFDVCFFSEGFAGEVEVGWAGVESVEFLEGGGLGWRAEGEVEGCGGGGGERFSWEGGWVGYSVCRGGGKGIVDGSVGIGGWGVC